MKKHYILVSLCLIGVIAFGGYNIKSKTDQQDQIKQNIKKYVAEFNDKKLVFNELSREDMGFDKNEEINTCPYPTKIGSECRLSKGVDGEYIIQEYEQKHDKKVPTNYYIVIFEHIKGKAEAMLMKKN